MQTLLPSQKSLFSDIPAVPIAAWLLISTSQALCKFDLFGLLISKAVPAQYLTCMLLLLQADSCPHSLLG
jgi:hypothetical protein